MGGARRSSNAVGDASVRGGLMSRFESCAVKCAPAQASSDRRSVRPSPSTASSAAPNASHASPSSVSETDKEMSPSEPYEYENCDAWSVQRAAMAAAKAKPQAPPKKAPSAMIGLACIDATTSGGARPISPKSCSPKK